MGCFFGKKEEDVTMSVRGVPAEQGNNLCRHSRIYLIKHTSL